MGLFDGVGGTDRASAWQIAVLEDVPVILVVRPSGSSLTLAAQLRGMLGFRSPSKIVGIVLTDCKPGLAAHLAPIVERECDIPVLGYLPPMEEAMFASRHLGLVSAHEVPNFESRIDAIASVLSESCDIDAVVSLAGEVRPFERQDRQVPPRCRIGVARDEAFCFYYNAGLACLQAQGAELVDVSPLHDTDLPTVDGLYMGGGYPELHAAGLAANRAMRRAMREALHDGLPTVAECGGFMYLQETLVDGKGAEHLMVGALPGRTAPAGHLVRFGYAHLVADDDSLLLRAGERLPVHEFHHWESTHNGADLTAQKPNGRSWRCCHATPSLHAGFPHLHFLGELTLAARFVARAAEFGGQR
jgi:cobyrinic acid a,c-diamide synthase